MTERFTEGKINKGGVNKKPTTPKPKVIVKPQTPKKSQRPNAPRNKILARLPEMPKEFTVEDVRVKLGISPLKKQSISNTLGFCVREGLAKVVRREQKPPRRTTYTWVGE